MKLYPIIFVLAALGFAWVSGQIQPPDAPQSPGVKNLRVHSKWTCFLHPRFGFELPIPPGVSTVGNPEAANQPQFHSSDQSFAMSAWGGISSDNPSMLIARQWESAQRKGDRKITYQKQGKTWFVVSGTDARGIEFYEKFIMRGQHVAYLEITFPRSRLRQYETWVEKIEDGFRTVGLKNGQPEPLPQLSRDQDSILVEGMPRERIGAEGLEQTVSPTQKSDLTAPPTKKSPEVQPVSIAARLPYAEKVMGKPGFVYSPFRDDHRIVDVVDVPSGTQVKCPYTLKNFRVP